MALLQSMDLIYKLMCQVKQILIVQMWSSSLLVCADDFRSYTYHSSTYCSFMVQGFLGKMHNSCILCVLGIMVGP